jgi:hypothetical protein
VPSAVIYVSSLDVDRALGVVAVSVSLFLFLCIPLPVTLPARNKGKALKKDALELIKDI